MAAINCDGHTTREINSEIRRFTTQGEIELAVKNPGGRHNLGVAVLQPVRITYDGSVGYYCSGMIDGPTVEIHGSAGWGLAESMMNGTVIVHGSAGNGAAASIRGGTVVIHGDVAARAAVSMKGGLVVIAGNCGYMAGFMGQRGTIIVCGDAGEAFADSMYETVCFVGGNIAELGNDAVVEQPSEIDLQFISKTLDRSGISDTQHALVGFKKVIAGRKLWNFDTREWTTWREAM